MEGAQKEVKNNSALQKCFIQHAYHISVFVEMVFCCGFDSFAFFMEQKDKLKVLLKEKEEGARGAETVKVQLRSTLVSDFKCV